MLRLNGATYHPDSFGLMLHYCANLKAIRYESTSANGIVADKSHPVIVAYVCRCGKCHRKVTWLDMSNGFFFLSSNIVKL